MKLLFAHDHRFIPHQGTVYSTSGFSRGAWDRYLREFNEVVVAGRKGTMPEDKEPDDLTMSDRERLEFEFLPNLSSLRGQFLERDRALNRLRKRVKSVDAVVARTSIIGNLAAKVARAYHRPYLIELTADRWNGLWYYGGIAGKCVAPVHWWDSRQVISRAPFVLYVTQRVLQERYPCPAGRTIGCSNVRIDPPEDRVLTARVERIERAPQPITFGLIGSLIGHKKGIGIALEAFRRAKSALPPFEFRVLGGGDPERWNERARDLGVDSHVYFDGTVPAGEPVMNWLDGVDVYLQPSLNEGVPRATIEAMSRGCPVVASRCVGLPEIVAERCLVDKNAPGQLADLLEKSVEPDWQKRYARRNFRVAQEFSSDRLVERRKRFYGAFADYARDRSS